MELAQTVIMANNISVSKLNLIDEICKRHPSRGVAGGIADTGNWLVRKMLDVPEEELRDFLWNKLIKEEEEVENFLCGGNFEFVLWNWWQP